ncbi:MAG: excinuclease ABC subunit UvrB [Candidatus Kaiserbacteria bacterium]|nr:excinuclease ABC subunit UvrB [Candidatus Kaiserbacteria bacterium]
MRSSNKFVLTSDKKPAGDQPKAIEALMQGLYAGVQHQTLLGVTGSGKTFTVANVIAQWNKPTLVIAHNKTLAAQLAQEYKEFFPDSPVHYFVSYYDYYQPEAYVPGSDTYIAKEALVNQEIDRLRHAATQALLTRSDVIVVASVSCIYGLGSPEAYEKVHLRVAQGMALTREELVRKAISLYFERTTGELQSGKVRVIADAVEIMPVHEEVIYRITFDRSGISGIVRINALTRAIEDASVDVFFLFPAKHFVSDKEAQELAVASIEQELQEQLAVLDKEGKVLEHERLRRRTLQDLALIKEIGYCNGIENYSRHFDRRMVGEAPHTLLSYFPKDSDGKPDFLTVIDESHVTVPQIGGMYAGDRSRKDTLVEHGFRLPSARDNRPLTFEEFAVRVGSVIYTSATPDAYEQEHSKGHIVEQIIRPTGLIDPKVAVHPVTGTDEYPGQVKDFITEAQKDIAKGGRVLVTTLTKKTSEELAEYLADAGVQAEYLHSEVKTIERIELLTQFRKGAFDVLVGVNLLREGLDLPEVTLVAILDADKEGFLRSETSLIQTIGRAARNVDGRVILYADRITGSLQRATGETERRRKLQLAYNKKHNITPKTIVKNINDITEELEDRRTKTVAKLAAFDIEQYRKAPKKTIREKERRMADAVAALDFETAALVRDEIRYLEEFGK